MADDQIILVIYPAAEVESGQSAWELSPASC